MTYTQDSRGAAPKQSSADGTGEGKVDAVPALDRGLRMLLEFSAREPEFSAPELAKQTGVPRTTTFRLLQTLEKLGFLVRGNTEHSFRLGAAVLRLGFESMNGLELTDFGQPILDRLRDATGLSTHLLIREGGDVVFIARSRSLDPLQVSTKVQVGTRLPAHATVHGLVLMGDMTSSDLVELYPRILLQRYTDETPATVGDLYARVKMAAKRGYAVSEAYLEADVSVVSAPVRAHGGKIVAAISAVVAGPRLAADVAVLTSQVCAAALELSSFLNYRPSPVDPTAAQGRAVR
ncbi:IclR family transcriptional regulator [Paraburkholderia sp. J63]|uniref:IclR family transcriptional regulator n=1 Tax=Paraburkholderia sp. J63 TaxID=2805434 RepID=UPI002ABD4873|nr:IclR family transcriptional regulator [Paraburkholderia sp. J63]